MCFVNKCELDSSSQFSASSVCLYLGKLVSQLPYQKSFENKAILAKLSNYEPTYSPCMPAMVHQIEPQYYMPPIEAA